jgi:branched-chain amino acid transport system permease protein
LGGGAALAALAGVIAAPFLSTYPGMGLDVLLDCFVVIVVGGFGSLLGAFVTSLMLGELQSFGVLWIQAGLVFQFLHGCGLIVRPPAFLENNERLRVLKIVGRMASLFPALPVLPEIDVHCHRNPHLCLLR